MFIPISIIIVLLVSFKNTCLRSDLPVRIPSPRLLSSISIMPWTTIPKLSTAPGAIFHPIKHAYEITPGLRVLYDDKSTWCRIIVDIWYSLFIAVICQSSLPDHTHYLSGYEASGFKSLTLWSQLLDHCRFVLEFDLNCIHVELQASYHEISRKNVTRLTTRYDTSSGLGRSPSYLGTVVVSGICSKFFHISELLETKILSGLIKIYLLKGFSSSRADNSVRFTGRSCRFRSHAPSQNLNLPSPWGSFQASSRWWHKPNVQAHNFWFTGRFEKPSSHRFKLKLPLRVRDWSVTWLVP